MKTLTKGQEVEVIKNQPGSLHEHDMSVGEKATIISINEGKRAPFFVKSHKTERFWFVKEDDIKISAESDAKTMVDEYGPEAALRLSESYLAEAVELEANTDYWQALRDDIAKQTDIKI